MEKLPEVFCAQAGQIIAADTQKTADHLLKKEGDNWVLTIPKQDAAGFEVTVIADEREITVYTEYGAHRHYTSDGNHPEVVKEAMGACARFADGAHARAGVRDSRYVLPI